MLPRTFMLLFLLFFGGSIAATERHESTLSETNQINPSTLLAEKILHSISTNSSNTPAGLVRKNVCKDCFELMVISDPAEFERALTNAKKDSKFSIEELVIANGKLVNVIYNYDVYESMGVSLFYKNNVWYYFYRAGVSSKGFTPMFNLAAVGNNKLDAIMCISDCDWWGKNANVVLDMENLTLKVIEPVDISYQDWVATY